MKLENKEQLVKLIEELDIDEGFDFVGTYKNGCTLNCGVRKIDIIASDCIVFGGYGAVHFIFDLSHDMTDEIVDKILASEELEITDIEVLDEKECW